MGVPALREALPGVPVYVHPGDAGMSKPFFRIEEMGELTFYEEDAQVKVGETVFSVLHTPGHTPWAAPISPAEAMRRCGLRSAVWARWRGI